MGHGDLLFNIEINGGSMNPLSPKQILRNLEHGYFMTHQEQSEAAQYIRDLQALNEVLKEGLLKSAEEVARLRQQFNLWDKGEIWTSK